MTPDVHTEPRVLAIDPYTQGFGYAVLENLCTLVASDLAAVRTDKAKRGMRRVRYLIKRYQPDVLVVEDCDAWSRRRWRVRRFLRALEEYGDRCGKKTTAVSRVAVYEVFERCHAQNRHDIALAIVRLFPHLAERLPHRKITWGSVDPRTHIFGAIALAVTFVCRNQG